MADRPVAHTQGCTAQFFLCYCRQPGTRAKTSQGGVRFMLVSRVKSNEIVENAHELCVTEYVLDGLGVGNERFIRVWHGVAI